MKKWVLWVKMLLATNFWHPFSPSKTDHQHHKNPILQPGRDPAGSGYQGVSGCFLWLCIWMTELTELTEDGNTSTSQVQGSIPPSKTDVMVSTGLALGIGTHAGMVEALDDSMESMRICKLFWADVDSAAPKWGDDFLLVVCISVYLWTAGGWGKELVTQQTPTWVSPKIGATKSVSLFQEQGNHRGLGA